MATKEEMQETIDYLTDVNAELRENEKPHSLKAALFGLADLIGEACNIDNGSMAAVADSQKRFDNGLYPRAGVVNAILQNAQFQQDVLQDTTNRFSLTTAVDNLRQAVEEMRSPDSEVDLNRVEFLERMLEQAQAKMVVAERVEMLCRDYFDEHLEGVPIREYKPSTRNAENPRIATDDERQEMMKSMAAKIEAASSIINMSPSRSS